MTQQQRSLDNSYSPHHPWYYVLGGTVLPPKQIREAVRTRGYKGYMERHIADIDQKAEPERSERLRKLRAQETQGLQDDISIYRACAYQLHALRKLEAERAAAPKHADIHTDISLKFNHITNRFAHLIWLDELLSVQRDLFEL